MQIKNTELNGLLLLTLEEKHDDRGSFTELYNKEKLNAAGIDITPTQINQSRSRRNVVRGLHFQWEKPLSKLIRIARGSAYVVAVDIRKQSDTLGRWFGTTLSEKDPKVLFTPAGFAFGFCALENDTDIEYVYSTLYNPNGEGVIRWNDTTLGIAWPVTDVVVSARDKDAPSFKEWLKRPESDLF